MRLFTGSYTAAGNPGIVRCALENGKLKQLDVCDALSNATWLTMSGDMNSLYAVGTCVGHGDVVAGFDITPNDIRLASIQPTGGNSSCHLSLDENGHWLVAAHYHTGKLSLYPLENGRILAQKQLIEYKGSGPVKGRQEEPHPHHSAWRPGHSELYVCDLGTDNVHVYRLEDELMQIQVIAAPAGTGPRHLLFDGPDKFYVCAEISSQVLFYRYVNSVWRLLQVISTLPVPVDGNTAAAIRLFGSKLYVSNRGHDSIACFGIAADGRLGSDSFIPSMGKGPRDFVRLQEGFLIAHQFGGGLQYLGQGGKPLDSLPLPGVVCVAGTGC